MNTAQTANDSIAVRNIMADVNVSEDEFFFTNISDRTILCTIILRGNSIARDSIAQAIDGGLFALYEMDRIDDQWSVARHEYNKYADCLVFFIENLHYKQ